MVIESTKPTFCSWLNEKLHKISDNKKEKRKYFENTDACLELITEKERIRDKQKVEKKAKSDVCFSLKYGFFATFFTILGIFCIKYSIFELVANESLNMRFWQPIFILWKEPDAVITVKVYLFNVTNAEEFLSGDDDKIKLEEFGPIIYHEKMRHTDIERHENNSTLTFTAHKDLSFPEDLNEPGILNRTLVVPNLITLIAVTFLEDAGYFVNLGANGMFKLAGETPFKEITVYDYLWNHKSTVLDWIQTLTGSTIIPVDNIGILHTIYTNFTHRLNVKIGAENGKERFFHMNTYDDRTTVPGFKLENGDCDATLANSTEGVLYSQNLTQQSVITYWRKTLCMPVKLYYEEELQKGPFTANKYVLPNDTFDRLDDEEKDCYGHYKSRKLEDGIADMSNCYFGFPFVASKPHFLGRNVTGIEKIDGLHPNWERHESFIIAEQKLGIPLDQCARSMSSIAVSDHISSAYPYSFRKFEGIVMPIVWFEYHLYELKPFLSGILNLAVNVLPAVESYVGPFCLVFSFYLLCRLVVHQIKIKQIQTKYKMCTLC